MDQDLLQLIRNYKIENLNDDDITKRLSANYSREEITQGLAALQYMRPANQQAYTSTVNPPASPDAAEMFKIEAVKDIIDKRKKGAMSGTIVILLVLTATALFDQSISKEVLLILAVLLPIPLSALYTLNAKNYVHLQPSYRTWNTWIYDYGSKLLVIGSVFAILSNLKNIANPFYGFKDAGVRSKSDLLVDTAVEATVGALAYTNLKPAKYVEEYFKQNETLHKNQETKQY